MLFLRIYKVCPNFCLFLRIYRLVQTTAVLFMRMYRLGRSRRSKDTSL
jgi:hypothetical protein